MCELKRKPGAWGVSGLLWPALLMAIFLVSGFNPVLAETVLPELSFVRGGILWQGADTPEAVFIRGAEVIPQVLPHGRGLWLPVVWKPRERLTITWRTAAGMQRTSLRSPLRPTALPWHVEDWPPVRFGDRGVADVVSALAFAPDGSRLAMGSQQGRLEVLDVRSGEIIARWRRPGRVIRQLAFSADGTLLFAGEQGAEGRLAAYRIDRGGDRPEWILDTARELGASRTATADPYAWAHQPGAYRLWRQGSDLFAAFTRSWREDGEYRVRSRLYRIDGATGIVRWRYPAERPAEMMMTWFSASADGRVVALPLQLPTGAEPAGRRSAGAPYPVPGAAGDSGMSRVIFLDGTTGRPRYSYPVPPLHPFPFAAIWRGVALHPQGGRAALATEDGRGMLLHREQAGWRATRELTLVRPVEIAGVPVIATNGTLAATGQEVIFATGPSYVPVEFGAGLPRGSHPRGNSLLAHDWGGRGRWSWRMGADLQGLALAREGAALAVALGREGPQPEGAFNGIALLDLRRQGSGRDRLMFRHPVAGRVVYGAVAISPDGRWLALGEAPRTVLGKPGTRGAARIWILR